MQFFFHFFQAAAHTHSTVSSSVNSAETFAWAYSVMDSSRVSTFFISILLIVYGSFRSLALEEGAEGSCSSR
jgi:hypothetical protein